MENKDTIKALLERVRLLDIQQNKMNRELVYLRMKLNEMLQAQEVSEEIERKIDVESDNLISETLNNDEYQKQIPEKEPSDVKHYLPTQKIKKKSDLEKIIGESWINKVGILILIIGIFLGVEYSIDNNLISPLTRIVLGYLSGLTLLVFGFRLRSNYVSYSAMLVGGAMAVFYIITYIAYTQYALIGLVVAFVMMVIFTIFTILASIWYDKMIISVIGLVGAYAIPFLLSSNNGSLVILLSYIILINTGILIICVRKLWKLPAYIAFVFTSIVQIYLTLDSSFFHSELIFLYATLFFIQFYAVIITGRIIHNQKISVFEVIWLFSNAILYYGIGFYLVDVHLNSDFLGLFTLLNAVIHFLVGLFLKNKKLIDNTLIYSVLGLVVAFLTLAIPIQLEGVWIVLVWGVISALLYWFSIKSKEIIYQYFSLVLASLAFVSVFVIDVFYLRIILNSKFVVSVFLVLSYVFILYNYLRFDIFKTTYPKWSMVYSALISFYAIVVLYFAFSNEISNYFEYKVVMEATEDAWPYYSYGYVYATLKTVCLTIYSLFFVLGLLYLNRYKIGNKYLGIISLVLLVLLLLQSITVGFYLLGNLRETCISSEKMYSYGFGRYVAIRYVLIAAMIGALYAIAKTYRDNYYNSALDRLKIPIEIVIYFFVLCIVSNELITWLSLGGYYQIYKLGLSILWGVFSLILIYFGIIRQKKHLRIASIVLFGITIIKVFLYDISHLSTVSKIVVFISLGVLLLISSFLYNKFKDRIDNEK